MLNKANKTCCAIIIAICIAFLSNQASAFDKEELRQTFPNWELYANGAVFGLNVFLVTMSERGDPAINPPNEWSADYEIREDHKNLNHEHFGMLSDGLMISLVLAPPVSYAVSRYVPEVGIKSPELKFFAFLEAMNVNELFTESTKKLIGRERPDGSDNESFISGHSSTSFAAATFFAWDLSGALSDKVGSDAWVGYRIAARTVPFAALYGAASMVAYYRIAAEKHYFTDVLAGGLTGAICGNAIYLYHFDTKGNPRKGKSQNTFLMPTFSEDYKGVELVYYF